MFDIGMSVRLGMGEGGRAVDGGWGGEGKSKKEKGKRESQNRRGRGGGGGPGQKEKGKRKKCGVVESGGRVPGMDAG